MKHLTSFSSLLRVKQVCSLKDFQVEMFSSQPVRTKHTFQPELNHPVFGVSRFINARRRILQPMLDASSSETPKAKKKTPQNRPLQRFWPDSIAAGGGTHQQVTMPDGRQHCSACGEDFISGHSGSKRQLTAVRKLM